jgi:hypothetical protein
MHCLTVPPPFSRAAGRSSSQRRSPLFSLQMLVAVLELHRSAPSHRAPCVLMGKLQRRYHHLPLRHRPQLNLCPSVHRASTPEPVAVSRAAEPRRLPPPRAPVRASLLPLRRHMPSLATILLAASRYRRRDAASAMPPHAAAWVLSQRAWAACSVGRRGSGLHAHAEHGSCSAPCEQATGTVRMGRRQGIGPCLSLFSYFLNLIKSMQIQNFVQVWFELRKCEINFLE